MNGPGRMERELFRREMPWEKKEREKLEKEMRREAKRSKRSGKCAEEDVGAPLLWEQEKDRPEEKRW